MALQKGGPGERKVQRGHYLVFEDEKISKKVIVIALKKGSLFSEGSLLSVPKQCDF